MDTLCMYVSNSVNSTFFDNNNQYDSQEIKRCGLSTNYGNLLNKFAL